MSDMIQDLMDEYEAKFKALENEALIHNQSGNKKAFDEVVKKMAGLQMMIEGLKKMKI